MAAPPAGEQALQRLLRPDIATMEEYTPIVPFEVLSRRIGIPASEIIKLDANENVYGPAPAVYEALAACRHYNIYPDPEQTLLREAIEPHLGLPREHVIFGNGCDEVIDLTMRLFVMPGDGVLNLPPTFGMYSYNTSLCAGRLISVPRRADFSVDVDAVVAAVQGDPGIKMLVVNSPNNPDGSLIVEDELRRLLGLPVIVVLDEAYVDFAGADYLHWVPEHWNLIILRSFSKWAGLGGLRVGYGVYPLAIARELWKVKPPYSVNVAAQEAVLASFRARDYLMGNVRRIVAERERLYGLLAAIPGVSPYPSHANYILCRIRGASSRELRDTLARRGILLRYYDKPGLEDCVRISVGKPEHSDAVVAAMRDLLGASPKTARENGEPAA